MNNLNEFQSDDKNIIFRDVFSKEFKKDKENYFGYANNNLSKKINLAYHTIKYKERINLLSQRLFKDEKTNSKFHKRKMLNM